MSSPVRRRAPTWHVFDGVKYGYRTEQYDGLHNMYKKTRSEGFGAEAKRRIMLGSFVLSSGYYDAYYLKALRTKALIKQAFDKAFEKYDVILGPGGTDDGTEARRVLERSAENVSGRHLYDFREPCGTSGNYASLRNGSKRTPDRFTAHRRLLRGEKDHPRGIRLRADQKLRTQSVGTMTVGG